MNSIEELAKYIGLDKVPKSWYEAYKNINKEEISLEKLLDKRYFSNILEFYRIDVEEFKTNLFETIELIKKDKKLKLILYLFYYILFIDRTGLYKDIWNWEMSNNLFKNSGSYMVPVIALLSGYEIHKKNMEKRNFDKEQIEEQIKNIKECCFLDKKRFNIDGIGFRQMVWGSYFINGKIIQVGRLQYEYPDEISNEVLKYKEGNYMYIHIPRGSKLNIDQVNDSICKSKNKIKIFYPEIDISKLQYYTESWLLSNELDDILDKGSNILKFKDKFDIIKQTENNKEFLNFVFQEKGEKINFNFLKEDTKLQKKLKKYLINNKKLHIGLGVLKNN